MLYFSGDVCFELRPFLDWMCRCRFCTSCGTIRIDRQKHLLILILIVLDLNQILLLSREASQQGTKSHQKEAQKEAQASRQGPKRHQKETKGVPRDSPGLNRLWELKMRPSDPPESLPGDTPFLLFREVNLRTVESKIHVFALRPFREDSLRVLCSGRISFFFEGPKS